MTGIRRRHRVTVVVTVNRTPGTGLTTRNPQGNYCPVGENPDGSCSEPGPSQCPSSMALSFAAGRGCECPEGTEKQETLFAKVYFAYCAPPYDPPKDGLANNEDALEHYFRGEGQEIEIHEELKKKLEAVSVVLEAQRGLAAGTEPMGTSEDQVKLSLDMGWDDSFFIGDTHIYYYATCPPKGQCAAMFTWGPDRFEDPLGLNIEILFGTPYIFTTHSWPFEYDNPAEAPADD